MNKVMPFILLLMFALPALAQNKHTVSGTVKDKTTGETLIGVVVRTEDKSIGTTTNEYGFYSLSLPAGEYTIKINYVGYAEQSQKVTLDKDVKLDGALVPEGKQLKEVVVSSKAKNENVTSSQMGVNTL